jgi:hypothetical protein
MKRFFALSASSARRDTKAGSPHFWVTAFALIQKIYIGIKEAR